MQSIKKDAEENGDNPDFLKLYMLDKEKSRLEKEKKGIQLRLDPINSRLEEISEYYAVSLGRKFNTGSDKDQDLGQDGKNQEWETVGINY
jgi:hypothetical protein